MYLILKNKSSDIIEDFEAYFDPDNKCYIHPELFSYKILEKEK